MISISYQGLLLTVIALALVAMAIAAVWFAHRARQTLERFDRLAPTYERVGIRAEALLVELEAIVEQIRGATVNARPIGSNGADSVDAALGLVRQLTAVGSGIKTAVEAFQSKKRA